MFTFCFLSSDINAEHEVGLLVGIVFKEDALEKDNSGKVLVDLDSDGEFRAFYCYLTGKDDDITKFDDYKEALEYFKLACQEFNCSIDVPSSKFKGLPQAN
jgi:hypothetical protein